MSTTKSTSINVEFVIKSIMMVGDEYNKKLLLGGIIAKTDVEKKKILQDSLSCEYKDALDLYWNKKQLMNIDNVILKS